jgi:deoxyribodipyrimidine photolyase-like uncharacterized protein
VVTCNPEKFAEWFNEKYPGAYRHVVAQDVKDMMDCGCYIAADIIADPMMVRR